MNYWFVDVGKRVRQMTRSLQEINSIQILELESNQKVTYVTSSLDFEVISFYTSSDRFGQGLLYT